MGAPRVPGGVSCAKRRGRSDHLERELFRTESYGKIGVSLERQVAMLSRKVIGKLPADSAA